jgi:hypothetical protein
MESKANNSMTEYRTSFSTDCIQKQEFQGSTYRRLAMKSFPQKLAEAPPGSHSGLCIEDYKQCYRTKVDWHDNHKPQKIRDAKLPGDKLKICNPIYIKPFY